MMETKTHSEIDPRVLQMLSSVQAWHYRAIPIEGDREKLRLLVDESSFDAALREELELVKNTRIETQPVSTEEIKSLLLRHYRTGTTAQATTKTTVSVSTERAESFVDDLVKEAKDLGSSDIHIETYEEECRVRIRIDGKLIEKYRIGKGDYPSLVNKLKIRANLDIAEKRLPQDGRINFKEHNDQFDIRVSVLPTMYGEKVVMRILNQDASRLDIEKLGMTVEQRDIYKDAIRKPDGIILISGPTGSGKTTTLYATLKALNTSQVNISTVEDPIEYSLEGINQVQVRDSIGLSFASALRSFLRQDPDIIMLGEIRDSETAQMAIRASLTGHLVLSTIHTNSAVDTISRLIDMGIPPFLIASTVHLSVAQRLIRLLCPECKQEEAMQGDLWPLGFQPPRPVHTHARPVGCEHCFYTGYRGRLALYETLPINETLRNSIRHNDNLKPALPKDHKTLSDAAFDALENGLTSIEEAFPLLENFG